MKKKIIILGGGLSGIYLGFRLKKAGFAIKILEASDSIGGRINTKNVKNTKIELGAAWLWRSNSELLKVCNELDLPLFPQHMKGDALFEPTKKQTPQRFQVTENQEISYRIAGGTATILEKLSKGFSRNELQLHQKVVQITATDTSIKVITARSEFTSDVVVSTIPPQLLVNSVTFIPTLHTHLIQVANNTHTWMKDAIKFAVVYKKPFWREKGLSGAGFSTTGPFTEIYDHSNFDNTYFALMGFLNGTLANESKKYREREISQQLFHFFGDDGKKYLSYEEKVWGKEELLFFENNTFLSPHFNNGHTLYQQEFINGKFIVAGSETSPSYGGYMEGAIYRGNQIVAQLKNKFN
ncbi:MAG: monoamine oxidase [Polaribacter sp.]|jgi:monoamine oxidase